MVYLITTKSALFTDLFQKFDDFVGANFLTTYLGAVVSSVSDIVNVLLTIYVLFMAVKALRGISVANTTEMIKHLVLVVFCVKMATNGVFYKGWIVDTFNSIPDYVKTLISFETKTGGVIVTTLPSLLDSIIDDTVGQLKSAWSALRSWEIGQALAITIYYIFVVIFLVSAAFLVLIAKITLAILIVVGPLVFIMLIFESTRHFFVQWMMYAVNIFLTILITVMVLLTISSVDLSNNLNFDDIVSMLRPILVLGIGFAIMRQVPNLASSLSGGIGLSQGLSDRLTSALSGGAKGGAKKVAGKSKDRMTRNYSEKREAKHRERVSKHKKRIERKDDINLAFRTAQKEAGNSNIKSKLKSITTSTKGKEQYIKANRNKPKKNTATANTANTKTPTNINKGVSKSNKSNPVVFRNNKAVKASTAKSPKPKVKVKTPTPKIKVKK